MTIYFITSQTGLQYITKAEDEWSALKKFDEDVGIDPHNKGLLTLIHRGYLEIHEIDNLEALLEYIKEWNDEYTQGIMSDLPTFGGDIPSDTTHVWSWDEDRLLIGTCSDDYDIMTRKEWSEL